MFSSASLGPYNGPDYIAGIAGVEIVEQIVKQDEIIIPLSLPTVSLIHTGHIPSNDGFSLFCLVQPDHLISAQTVKCYSKYAIVDEIRRIGRQLSVAYSKRFFF